MLKIKEEQKRILEKFNIDYKVDDLRVLLDNIDFIMTDYRDENDEPLEEWLILEKVFDNIRYQNKK